MSKENYSEALAKLQHHIGEAIRLNEGPDGENRAEASKLEAQIKAMASDQRITSPKEEKRRQGHTTAIKSPDKVLLATVIILISLAVGAGAHLAIALVEQSKNASSREVIQSQRTNNEAGDISDITKMQSAFRQCNQYLDKFKNQLITTNRPFTTYLELNRNMTCKEAIILINQGYSLGDAAVRATNQLVARWDSKVSEEKKAQNAAMENLLRPIVGSYLQKTLEDHAEMAKERERHEAEIYRERVKASEETLKEVGRAF